MKCICNDFRRAITGRWFLGALGLSMAALYLSIGQDTHYLLSMLSDHTLLEEMDFGLRLDELLMQGLAGTLGVMVLPALSALPFALQPLQELKCGALRPAIFRVGRKSWLLGKTLAVLLSGMLLQGVAAVGLTLMFQLLVLLAMGQAFPMENLPQVLPLLLRRMLCGGLWAGVGCIAALLTETASAACLAPLCLCYAMVMIGTRFFPQALFLQPAAWLTGQTWPLMVALAAVAAAMLLTLRREVNTHA